MAHVFGLFHDGHGNTCTGRRYTTAIMAPLVEAKLNHYWWSECSRQRMREVINYLTCLNDDPDPTNEVKHYELDSGSQLTENLGRNWSLEFQCRLEFGNNFGLCAAFTTDACTMLWCSELSTPHLCRTKRGPPLPGSSCGHDRECRDSTCTYVGNEKPVHGQWASWSAWGECSIECGVGIKRRRRSCTNPKPSYGGRDCSGESEDWDTCLAKNCETFLDSRAGHCDVWNEMNIRSGKHDWQPYQTKRRGDECKQTCVSNSTGEVVTIDVEVSDGTPCTYEDQSNICYEGKCLKVGCDGIRNSSKRFDACGVCGGDNSECKTVTGRLVRAPLTDEEYESVVFLPKGAQNIEVINKAGTSHFIALKHTDYGKFVLNGGKRRENSRDIIAGSARFIYTYRPGLQNISSVGPLRTNLEVMLFPNRDRREAHVTYQYSISKYDITLEKRKFQWRFKDWSDCSVTCGEGLTEIIHSCIDKDTGSVVADESCSLLPPPRKDQASCSREPCSRSKYLWSMTNDWSPCSAVDCGQSGVEQQGYQCQRWHMDNDTYELADLNLCHSNSAPNETRPCEAPPCNLQWVVGEWTQCSQTCGQGRQTRSAYCGDPSTDADDQWCKDIPPPLSRECREKPCADGTLNDDACTDKYSFCARANGLSFKCQTGRFKQICCKACQEEEGAARRPALSHWDIYRQRILSNPKL